MCHYHLAETQLHTTSPQESYLAPKFKQIVEHSRSGDAGDGALSDLLEEEAGERQSVCLSSLWLYCLLTSESAHNAEFQCAKRLMQRQRVELTSYLWTQSAAAKYWVPCSCHLIQTPHISTERWRERNLWEMLLRMLLNLDFWVKNNNLRISLWSVLSEFLTLFRTVRIGARFHTSSCSLHTDRSVNLTGVCKRLCLPMRSSSSSVRHSGSIVLILCLPAVLMRSLSCSCSCKPLPVPDLSLSYWWQVFVRFGKWFVHVFLKSVAD